MTTIEILSELRSAYNCFDEKEEPYYRALSEAIGALDREHYAREDEKMALERKYDSILAKAENEASIISEIDEAMEEYARKKGAGYVT